MQKRDLRLLLLYEWKSDYKAAAAAPNINAAFSLESANKYTIRRWYGKFQAGDTSLANEERKRPEMTVDDGQLKSLVKVKLC